MHQHSVTAPQPSLPFLIAACLYKALAGGNSLAVLTLLSKSLQFTAIQIENSFFFKFYLQLLTLESLVYSAMAFLQGPSAKQLELIKQELGEGDGDLERGVRDLRNMCATSPHLPQPDRIGKCWYCVESRVASYL